MAAPDASNINESKSSNDSKPIIPGVPNVLETVKDAVKPDDKPKPGEAAAPPAAEPDALSKAAATPGPPQAKAAEAAKEQIEKAGKAAKDTLIFTIKAYLKVFKIALSLTLSLVGVFVAVLLIYYAYKTIARVAGADVSRFRLGNNSRSSQYESEYYDDLFEALGACVDAHGFDKDMHTNVLVRPWSGGSWQAESPRVKEVGELCSKLRAFGKEVARKADRHDVIRRLVDAAIRREDVERFPDEPTRLQALCYRVLKACIMFERDVYVWCSGFSDMPTVVGVSEQPSQTLPAIAQYLRAMYGTASLQQANINPERQMWLVERVRAYALRTAPNLASVRAQPAADAVARVVAGWLLDDIGEDVRRYTPMFADGGSSSVDYDVTEDLAQRMHAKIRDSLQDEPQEGRTHSFMVRCVRDIARLYTSFFAVLRESGADRHPVVGHYTRAPDFTPPGGTPKALMAEVHKVFDKASDEVDLLAIASREWLMGYLLGQGGLERYVPTDGEYMEALSAAASDPAPVGQAACSAQLFASMRIACAHVRMLLSDRYPPPEFLRTYQSADYMDAWGRVFKAVFFDGYVREARAFSHTFIFEATHYYGSNRKLSYWIVKILKFVFNPKNFWPTSLGGNGPFGMSWDRLKSKGEGFDPRPLNVKDEDIVEGFGALAVIPWIIAISMVLFAMIMGIIGAIAGMPITDIFLAMFGPILWFALMGVTIVLLALGILPLALFCMFNIVPFAAFLAVMLVVSVMYAAVFVVMGIVFVVDYVFHAASGGRISLKTLLTRWFSCQATPHDWYDIPNAHRGNRWSPLHFGSLQCGCMAPCGMGRVPVPSDAKVLRCEDATDNHMYSAQALLFRAYKQVQTVLPHSLDSAAVGQTRYDDIAGAVCRYATHLDRGTATLAKISRVCALRYCGGGGANRPCFCTKFQRPVKEEEKRDVVRDARDMFNMLDRRVQVALYLVFALICISAAIVIVGYLFVLYQNRDGPGGAFALDMAEFKVDGRTPMAMLKNVAGALAASAAAFNRALLDSLNQRFNGALATRDLESKFKRAYALGLAAGALDEHKRPDNANELRVKRDKIISQLATKYKDNKNDLRAFLYEKYEHIYTKKLPQEFCATHEPTCQHENTITAEQKAEVKTEPQKTDTPPQSQAESPAPAPQ